jgi:hypothetical protein
MDVAFAIHRHSFLATPKLCPSIITYPTPDHYGPFPEFYASDQILGFESVFSPAVDPAVPILISFDFALISVNYLPIIDRVLVFVPESPVQTF